MDTHIYIFYVNHGIGFKRLGLLVNGIAFVSFSCIGRLFNGGHFKLKNNDNKTYISVLTLLPFFISHIENFIGAIPGTYEAYTSIDIKSTPEKIWNNATRVKEIPVQQDKGWLNRSLGFPRPVKAELNYLGVGAYPKAIFTNGLVFHETVTEYTHQRKMVFTDKAKPSKYPPQPSTNMWLLAVRISMY